MSEHLQEKAIVDVVSGDESLSLPNRDAEGSWLPFADISPRLSIPDVVRLMICIIEQQKIEKTDFEVGDIYVSPGADKIKIITRTGKRLISENPTISTVGRLLIYALCRGNLGFEQITVEQWVKVRNQLKAYGVGSGLTKIGKRCLFVDRGGYINLAEVKWDLQNVDHFRVDSDNKAICLALGIVMTLIITFCSIYGNREEPLPNEFSPRSTVVRIPEVKPVSVKTPSWLKQIDPYTARWRVPCKAASFGTYFSPMRKNYIKKLKELRNFRTGKCIYRYSEPVTPSELVAKALLAGVDLSGVHFDRMNLVDVDFRGVSLSDCKFSKCELGDMSNMTFRNCSFEVIATNRCKGAKFLNCNLKVCHLTTGNFDYATFENTKIEDSMMTLAEFSGSRFQDSKLSNLSACMAKFNNCKFVRTEFKQIDFEVAKFRHSEFTECKPVLCIFYSSDFRGFNAVDTVFEKSLFSY